MSTIYNDFDQNVCCWLQSLIDSGHLSPGIVDSRPIQELTTDDLSPHTWCHFFAGIGGWDCALRLAGWPADAHVWTASLPCQPFSQAGKRRAEADDRHLWPVFYRLVAQCRPPVIFGEQVASPLGRSWLTSVRADLETLGYAVGSADLCAASIGAPHIRQRLYWMAYANGDGLQERMLAAKTARHRCATIADGRNYPSVWSNAVFVECKDGKRRPIPTEPSFFPLAHGVPARVVRLRGYGNAIVPQVTAQFILAAVEAIEDLAQ